MCRLPGLRRELDADLYKADLYKAPSCVPAVAVLIPAGSARSRADASADWTAASKTPLGLKGDRKVPGRTCAATVFAAVLTLAATVTASLAVLFT
jgi:uncharacterized protein YjlB